MDGARQWCDLRQATVRSKFKFNPMSAPLSAIEENYGMFREDDRSWDVAFWQNQGSAAIFDAVWGMIVDHRLITTGDAAEPRLQRTVEYFGPA